MDLHLRQTLEEIADRLHLHRGPGEARAHELHGEVQKALDEGEHPGLSDRLKEGAVEFETSHPDLADFLRRAVDTLSAAGL